MSAEKAALRRKLDKALAALPVVECWAIHRDIADRLARVDAGGLTAPMEEAGVWRSLASYADIAFRVERPDWPTVRRLHAAWVASQAWMKAR